MELIATARFKKAMDRASAATAYTERITQLVTDLTHAGLEVSHPLLEPREDTENATLLVLTANRGLCGGFNGNVQRAGVSRWKDLEESVSKRRLEVSGKRGISAFRFRKIDPDETFLHFEEKPTFEEVEVLANRYLEQYLAGQLDRLDVAYMKFESIARQSVTVETLLPLGSMVEEEEAGEDGTSEGTPGEGATGAGAGAAKGSAAAAPHGESLYEFLPSAESILEEVVPTSFKVKLFKCFLDSAVSEQIARMVAMKSATENADDLIKQLTMTYNRARQGRITSELMDVIGGVEALG